MVDYELAQYVLSGADDGDDKLADYLSKECRAVFAWLNRKFSCLDLGVESVMSETFIHLKEYNYSALKCYKGDMPLKTFIATMVCRRLAKQAARFSQKHGLVSSESEPVVTPENEKKRWKVMEDGPRRVNWDEMIPHGADREAVSCSFESEKVELWDMLSLLPVMHQRILVCRFMDGMTAAAVAEQFGIKPSKVDQIVKDSIDRIRDAHKSKITNVPGIKMKSYGRTC